MTRPALPVMLSTLPRRSTASTMPAAFWKLTRRSPVPHGPVPGRAQRDPQRADHVQGYGAGEHVN